MAFIPMALQLLPLLPNLIESTFKIVEAVRQDPHTPEDAKAQLESVSLNLAQILEAVKQVRLPERG